MYVELHCHSCFSFREGASTPLELIMAARLLGYRALALTDHDNLAGAMEFARTAKGWDLRPIIGAEVTLAPEDGADLRPAKSRGDGEHHLTLLAETQRGYANLSRLLSRANLNSPRGAPRVRLEWLPEHADGLIALSGCRKGLVPRLIEQGQPRAAREAAERYRAIFGRESFFIELQNNLVYEDQPRNEGLAALAHDLGLQVVATNNVHYHERQRHRLHDVLTAVRHRLTLEEARPYLRPNSEFHLKPESQMRKLFEGLPEAIENSVRIAERCTGSPLAAGQTATDAKRVEYVMAKSAPAGLGAPALVYRAGTEQPRGVMSNNYPSLPQEGPGQPDAGLEGAARDEPGPQPRGFDITRDLSYVFPDYVAEDGRSADEFLRDLCYSRARDWYGTPLPEEVEIRLRQELELVRLGKRAGFFLRLWEVMEYAHANDLPARGRGSSVGSIVCFLLGLSGIDPMKYDLVVERFLNEDRLEQDVPDIDIDLGRDARDRMFRHIFEKYGTEHAAMVCNFIEYRYASAVRDVGKALGLPHGEVDKIAKRMRSRFARRLEDELAAMPEFAPRLRFPIWHDFVRLVEELKGMPRHLSQHSGGMIISTTRMDEQVPVEAAAMDGRYICQWDKDSVADAGFIKLDLLGYPSLDQLERGLRYVRERHGKHIRPQDIDLSDPEVYAMIQRGDVLGIVQIQSRAQIQVLLRIKVQRIEDLIIQVALIRPGPIQGGAVHPYIARCLGQEPVTYDHPSLEPALRETKGVFVFQEQVIQAAMAIAGFSSGQAEALRRAMSRKRSREAMEALHQEFLNGAAARGIAPDIAATVYEKIMAFASFGFPKSHAAAMAETAYRVAWLKRYYPVEFYCALLNEQPMGFYSPEVIANDARRHGIEIRGVDVNHSRSECTIEADDALRLGYKYLKSIGEAAWKRLDEEIVNGPYRSLLDFWRRTRLGREAIENLIRAGAFAWTGLHERELLWQLGTFYQPLNAQLPLALLEPGTTPRLREMDHNQRVLADLLLTGLAVRGRSMDLVADYLHEGITPSHMLERLQRGDKVTVAGLVAVRQAPETAKGFVFHTLEDYYGLMNVITAPRLVRRYRWLIESAPALIVHGHIEREERSVNVIAEHFEPLGSVPHLESRVHSFG